MNKLVYWPDEADTEDALIRWDITEQTARELWPKGTSLQTIKEDLESFTMPGETPNIARDAGIFHELVNRT